VNKLAPTKPATAANATRPSYHDEFDFVALIHVKISCTFNAPTACSREYSEPIAPVLTMLDRFTGEKHTRDTAQGQYWRTAMSFSDRARLNQPAIKRRKFAPLHTHDRRPAMTGKQRATSLKSHVFQLSLSRSGHRSNNVWFIFRLIRSAKFIRQFEDGEL
jgi:hypothetical protein